MVLDAGSDPRPFRTSGSFWNVRRSASSLLKAVINSSSRRRSRIQARSRSNSGCVNSTPRLTAKARNSASARAGKFGGSHLSERAFATRVRADGLRTAHSFIRSTIHPSRRSACDTRRSRRLLAWILSRQNFLLLRGRYLQGQPCQKHPSTNTAIFLPGHAKSGFPATGQCLR